jgi:2-polyprenyl-3-methyl-5-hydroxy-6-metoxy-1,4-benzoquinol methylase
MLGSAGAESVTGVDLDPDTIEHARARFQFGAVAFAVGDAEQLRLDGPFDVVVSFETIEHLQRPERLLASVGRMLNVDGTFLVSTPCRESGSLDGAPQNPFHVREWNQVEFSAMLESAFRSVTLYGQLIEFAKNRLPFNRTLARLVTSLVKRSRLRKMYSCDVVPLEGLPPAGLRICYLVAVCREPLCLPTTRSC